MDRSILKMVLVVELCCTLIVLYFDIHVNDDMLLCRRDTPSNIRLDATIMSVSIFTASLSHALLTCYSKPSTHSWRHILTQVRYTLGLPVAYASINIIVEATSNRSTIILRNTDPSTIKTVSISCYTWICKITKWILKMTVFIVQILNLTC